MKRFRYYPIPRELLRTTYGKYHVSPPEERILDGILFASKAEMKRYGELKFLERAKKIKDLTVQPKFVLLEAFERHGVHHQAIHYVGDFLYYDNELKRKIVEDVKGVETEVFRLKKKLFAYNHNLELRIVKA